MLQSTCEGRLHIPLHTMLNEPVFLIIMILFKERSHSLIYKQTMGVKCQNYVKPVVHSASVIIVYIWLPLNSCESLVLPTIYASCEHTWATSEHGNNQQLLPNLIIYAMNTQTFMIQTQACTTSTTSTPRLLRSLDLLTNYSSVVLVCVSVCPSIHQSTWTNISVTPDSNFLIWGMIMGYGLLMMLLFSNF